MLSTSSQDNRCGKKAALFQRLSAALTTANDALRSAATRAALIAFVASAALFHPNANAVEVLKQATELQPLVIAHNTPQSEVIRLARERGAEGKLIAFPISDTGSMDPVLTGGDVVICEKTPAKIDLEDIVVTNAVRADSNYYDPKSARGTCHRVVNFARDGSIVTQGDALQRPDAQRSQKSDIIGKVVLVLRR